MDEHDESLEIGIAAGFDIPTAMVIFEQTDVEQPTNEKSWNRAVVVAVIIGMVVMAVVCLM